MALAAGSWPEIERSASPQLADSKGWVLAGAVCQAPLASSLAPQHICALITADPSPQGSHNLEAAHISHSKAAIALFSDPGAMALQWVWAGAVAVLERNSLESSVGLALEMKCTLCSSLQLCRC